MGLLFPGRVGSFWLLRRSLIMAFLRVMLSELPKLEYKASCVIVLSSYQKTLRWLTMNPSTPGLESPFMVFTSVCVSSSVVSSPSMLPDNARDIFLFLSSSIGAVSPSEFM